MKTGELPVYLCGEGALHYGFNFQLKQGLRMRVNSMYIPENVRGTIDIKGIANVELKMECLYM